MSANDDKSEVVSLILSFLIVGLGQAYQGRLKVAALLFGAAVVSGILIPFMIGLVLLPIVWIVNLYDAYTQRIQL